MTLLPLPFLTPLVSEHLGRGHGCSSALSFLPLDVARGLWKEAASGTEGREAIEGEVEGEGRLDAGWSCSSSCRLLSYLPVPNFPLGPCRTGRSIYEWSKTGAVGLLITAADVFSPDLPGEGRSGQSL